MWSSGVPDTSSGQKTSISWWWRCEPFLRGGLAEVAARRPAAAGPRGADALLALVPVGQPVLADQTAPRAPLRLKTCPLGSRWRSSCRFAGCFDAGGADHPTVWSWVAVAGVAILLSLGGYGVIRMNRRQHRAIDAARSKADRVPSELRVAADPLWMRVSPLAVAIAVAVAVRLMIGSGAGIAVFGLIIAAFYIRTQRRRTAHQDEVIQMVRARASSMSHADLAELVEGLEVSHGRQEMRPLRRRLPEVPGPEGHMR